MPPDTIRLTRRTALLGAAGLLLSACSTTTVAHLNRASAARNGASSPLDGASFTPYAPTPTTVHPLDEALTGNHNPPPAFARTTVPDPTGQPAGTIVIDTNAKYLYLVEEGGMARRYGVGVGREGFGWKGAVTVGSKQEWPRWFPPKEMIARERARGRDLPEMMEGGPGNPLGARALYLYDGPKDTLFRIHGTVEPWTIGTNVSSGCIRMANADVLDLYDRVPLGAKVVVR